jgi:ATP-dependent Lon protease
MSPQLADEVGSLAATLNDPGRLADFVAQNLPNLDTESRQKILETQRVRDRLKTVHEALLREQEVLEVGSKIESQVKNEVGRTQREYYLREQMKAIQKELGENDESTKEIEDLRAKIQEAKMPEDAEKEALRELNRLSKIPPASAEYTVGRTYLDWLTRVPWSKKTEDVYDIPRAKEILEADHYDLEKVKDRILEFLAVRKMKPNIKGPILCFVGPPGVGKTSLGKSVAKALGRQFVRLSLGGIRDEAEIRGHRRTYIGALPGQIIQSLCRAGSKNPVFMLDEVDKLGMDFRGDPSAALLEVLDPEQNDTFRDNYIDLAFDLSEVLFIATANMMDPIPPALKDRMEIINLAGYTEEEKIQIAVRTSSAAARQPRLTDPAIAPTFERRPFPTSFATTRARPGSGTSSGRSPASAVRRRARSRKARRLRSMRLRIRSTSSSEAPPRSRARSTSG